MTEEWIVKGAWPQRDDTTRADDRRAGSVLIVGDIHPCVTQCAQGPFHPAVPNHFPDVAELAAGQLQHRQIWTVGVAKNGPLDQQQKTVFPLRHATTHGRFGLFQGDGMAEEVL